MSKAKYYYNSNSLTHNILEKEVHSNKACFLPFVLDKDPILAANFLTIEDSEKTFEIMLEVFKGIKSGGSKYELAEACVMWSFTNFNWFVKYTEELGKLVIGENTKIEFPINKCPDISLTYDKDKFNKPFFCPPLKYNGDKYRAQPVKFRTKVMDPIDCYRIIYISRSYCLEDFREGYPAWYSIDDVVVYEDYNARTNNRIRIAHKNGEYHYYITGASDNWKEIMDVPLEMDYVISALLFRN